MSRRPEDSKVVCFLDLETTGNRFSDRIIEVGAVIVDRDLNIIDHLSEVVKPVGWRYLLPDIRDEVIVMHTNNGLLQDVEQFGRPMGEVDVELAAMLRKHNGTSHVPLAGSGVAHFDRRYIRADMPETDKRLAYWAYDTGVMRRFLKWWGIEVPEADAAKDMKTHRALDDALAALHEARAYRDALTHDRHAAKHFHEFLETMP